MQHITVKLSWYLLLLFCNNRRRIPQQIYANYQYPSAPTALGLQRVVAVLRTLDLIGFVNRLFRSLDHTGIRQPLSFALAKNAYGRCCYDTICE